MRTWTFIFGFFFVLLANIHCSSDNENVVSSKDLEDSLKNISPPPVVKYSNKTFGVPSPVQISEIIKKHNIPYNFELLNPSSNYSKYETAFKKALNLGVYGADLAYILLYEQYSNSGEYFASVKKLSDGLGILNSLQEKTLERIEKNNENKDSLLVIISDVFRDIDAYLLDNDQTDIGVLILVGGWVESLYFTTKIANERHDKDIIQKVAEQKKPLENIIELLQPYYSDKNPEITELTEKLVDISIVFDGIEEIYEYKTSKTYPDKKLTVVYSKTYYKISDAQLNEITQKINELRNWIIE